MLPIKAWPDESLRNLRIVLCDIDDTLTWHGRLPAVAYQALENLRDSGLLIAPITGRPAGWCDHIARMWPVDGVVGENGAFYFRYESRTRKMIRRYWRTATQRREDREKLNTIADRVLAAVAGAGIAADQAYREADLAIDFREDVACLGDDQVRRIVEIFEQAGAVAKISSIHVNGWFGDYDKLAMTRRLFTEAFAMDLGEMTESVAFVGDSPNDTPMFGFFPNAVGVSNVAEFADSLTARPRWVTTRPGGFGFAEFADKVIKARR